ncbi:MAG: response regulator transcription factor [Gammaproteobacteria bacterium]|nr:response regulator transcription factor [Gammaproteobacteria bacterium]MDH5800028.1 response regulator transcription factor [Gammaproteobacteria bacterium]
MSRKPSILVVEDEAAIRTGLVDLLVYHGFDVDTAEDGNTGLSKSISGLYDLILLDIMLPGMDGYEICNRVRERDREQPIIMLTAKADDEDIIRGLQLGADDYVAKPFSVSQLVLRIQAVLRRARVGLESETGFTLGDLKIDTRNLSGHRGRDTIAFTRREMDILEYLSRHDERPVPREELLAKVWGYAKDLNLETRTVDIHIAKLRRKIESVPAEPRYLVTVRMAGYRLLKD